MARSLKTDEPQVEDKLERLKFIVNEGSRKFGIDKVKFGTTPKLKKSTGSIYFDYLIGGGYEEDTITLLYGKNGSGKSSMALRNVAAAQKRGETCAWLRIEKGMNVDYMEKLGVDVEKLIVVENLPYGEAYLDTLVDFVRAGIDMIIVDSISALVPKREIEGSIEDENPGLQSRLISKVLRKANAENRKSIIVFISQVRTDFSGMGHARNIYSGGNAAGHNADYIVEFRLKDKLTDDQKEVSSLELKKENKNEVTGANMLMYVEKCRRGVAHRAGEMYFSFKTGRIDEEGEVITVAEKLGMIKESGGWIKIDPEFSQRFGIKESCRVKELKTLLIENEEAKAYYVDKIKEVL